MQTVKKKSINTIGMIIIGLSVFMIISNGMGLLMASFIPVENDSLPNQINKTPMTLLLTYYSEVCLFMIINGVFYLLGGLFLLKYKLWANRFVSIVSGIQIFIMWAIMLIIRSSVGQEPGLEILNIWTIVVALAWTIPFGLLIWFLNRKDIMNDFV